jgi:hypothetical protein
VPTRRLLLFLVVAVVLIIAGSAGPALAVNDPYTPADECAPAEQAVGHPAAAHEQADPVSPPFSEADADETEEGDGAEGARNSQAPCAG